jgi:hypothetical protein
MARQVVFHNSVALVGKVLRMYSSTMVDVDFVEELRLRTWARQNFVSAEDRDMEWHPVVLEEMRSIDEESQDD